MNLPIERASADVELVAGCLSRTPGAWEELVERFGRLVYGVIYAALRRAQVRADTDRVEELFDSVFVALFDRDQRRLRQWSGRCSLASWVRLVAASVVVDQLRRHRLDAARARVSSPEALDAVPHDTPSALDLLVRAGRLEELRRALQTLSDSDRELLLRLVVDEVPPERLARELGVRTGTLYTRKTRALQRLREALARMLRGGAG